MPKVNFVARKSRSGPARTKGQTRYTPLAWRSYVLDVAVVAPVATVAKPASPDKAALAYLEATGARAISIVEVDDVAITVGMKPDAVAIFWLP
jgi:hypothetical protein